MFKTALLITTLIMTINMGSIFPAMQSYVPVIQAALIAYLIIPLFTRTH